jgi:peptidoglycan hydrolase-like protein with peptidoglycan-binding domain
VLRVGDTGPFVKSLQTSLGIIPVDGNFGRVTEGGVKGFQAAVGLAADGVVSEKTWTAVDELDRAKHAGNSGLAQAQINSIIEIADASEISSHDWGGRGTAPTGYTAGVALCFALAATWLAENDPVAMTMAQAARNNSEDALTWYHQEFAHLGMDNSEDGIDTLRHLFALMLGLALRESSGKYCEGRDLSADNVSADTAEAGMFQTSGISARVSPRIPAAAAEVLGQSEWLPDYVPARQPSRLQRSWQLRLGRRREVSVSFQVRASVPRLCDRHRHALSRWPEGHWGPLRRKEAELRPEADKMLLSVQHHLADVA